MEATKILEEGQRKVGWSAGLQCGDGLASHRNQHHIVPTRSQLLKRGSEEAKRGCIVERGLCGKHIPLLVCISGQKNDKQEKEEGGKATKGRTVYSLMP